jgi:hypothetical protein
VKKLGLLWIASALAAMATTTVSQTKITAGDGETLATGKITITATAAFLAADGTWVDTNPVIVKVINGAFTVNLEPNDTGVPSNTSYTAAWQLVGAAPRTDHWVIPTSGTALGLAAVRVSVAPAVGVTFNPQQLSQDSATIGQALCWTGATWAPGICGGTPKCLQVVAFSATPTFDFSLCTQQIITLTGGVTPVIANAAYCQVPGGCTITFVQGSPAYSVTWTGAVLGGFTIGSFSGKRNVQSFTSLDGSTLLGLNPGAVNQ